MTVNRFYRVPEFRFYYSDFYVLACFLKLGENYKVRFTDSKRHQGQTPANLLASCQILQISPVQ
jgi:hypothetical protein